MSENTWKCRNMQTTTILSRNSPLHFAAEKPSIITHVAVHLFLLVIYLPIIILFRIISSNIYSKYEFKYSNWKYIQEIGIVKNTRIINAGVKEHLHLWHELPDPWTSAVASPQAPIQSTLTGPLLIMKKTKKLFITSCAVPHPHGGSWWTAHISTRTSSQSPPGRSSQSQTGGSSSQSQKGVRSSQSQTGGRNSQSHKRRQELTISTRQELTISDRR